MVWFGVVVCEKGISKLGASSGECIWCDADVTAPRAALAVNATDPQMEYPGATGTH